MKYKVGQMTLLGEIVNLDAKDRDGLVYGINDGSGWVQWYLEEQVDKIIIKPKRNIDHIIELWDATDKKDRVANWVSKNANGWSVLGTLENMFKPYIEPSKYPKLTPDELKAVKWLVDGGFTHIDTQFAIYENGCSSCHYDLSGFPKTTCLKRCGKPQGTAIPLKELLDAQEVGK